MTLDQIRKQINEYQKDGLKIFVTSSFQTHSIPLLHILTQIDESIPVMFINTGFLFPETLMFRDKIVDLLNLNLVDVKSNVSKIHQRDCFGSLLYTSDPDYCCYLNKTEPIEPILLEYDVWVNGVRADQNANRRKMKAEQNGAFDCKRFHPVLDWSSKMIYDYIKLHNLPEHPLDKKGYLSIGCEPCTRKFDIENDRSGRWFGLNKTECGLHTDLIDKQ